MCENLHYKPAYFKQQHNDQAKNSINRQYIERGSCNINYYHCMRVLGDKRIKLKTQEKPLDFETMTSIRISHFGGLTG